mmetsp:Transcript_267/g.726  ORF Transcript_267/g.726 Transcript_267/m.726 type:complete len:302 (-) Transcript_267:1532-2437(-)
MRDGDDGLRPCLNESLEGFENICLRRSVKVCESLVEEEQGRLLLNRPCDRDPLLLPTAEFDAAFTKLSVISFRELLDEFCRVCRVRGGDDGPWDVRVDTFAVVAIGASGLRDQELERPLLLLLLLRLAFGHLAIALLLLLFIIAIGERDVRDHVAREDDTSLRNHGDQPSQPSWVVLPNIMSVNQDDAFLRFVEPLDESQYCRLPAPRGADHGDFRSSLDLERDAPQDGDIGAVGVAEPDILELDGQRRVVTILVRGYPRGLLDAGVEGRLDLVLCVDNFHDPCRWLHRCPQGRDRILQTP